MFPNEPPRLILPRRHFQQSNLNAEQARRNRQNDRLTLRKRERQANLLSRRTRQIRLHHRTQFHETSSTTYPPVPSHFRPPPFDEEKHSHSSFPPPPPPQRSTTFNNNQTQRRPLPTISRSPQNRGKSQHIPRNFESQLQLRQLPTYLQRFSQCTPSSSKPQLHKSIAAIRLTLEMDTFWPNNTERDPPHCTPSPRHPFSSLSMIKVPSLPPLSPFLKRMCVSYALQ